MPTIPLTNAWVLDRAAVILDGRAKRKTFALRVICRVLVNAAHAERLP